ncbi:MAG: hypothetical protein U9N42_02960, partial [Campylobacterota bacterium]|nr:hypothetical protein [Campylobacterota bacterium]
SVLSLLFAPSFLILIHYFEFKVVVLAYLFLSTIFLIYQFLLYKISKKIILPTLYIALLTTAYLFNNLNVVKLISVFMSMSFLALFIDSFINKREIILNLTKRFYKKEMSFEEEEFLKNADGFWVVVTAISTLILFVLVFSENDILWAMYSSIGWYIFFGLSLLVQIIYGRLYAIQMYSR